MFEQVKTKGRANGDASRYSGRRMTASNGQTGPWTVSRLLTWTRDYFKRQDVESPRLCAEILLAHAMGCARIHLYTQHESVPEAEIVRKFREAVREAATGRPIAYLTGTKEFFSLAFEVTPAVLIPRPDTEILVERTISLIRQSDGTLRSVLDLGTGCGCIAVSLAAHLPDAALFASDVSEDGVAVAQRNAERHEVEQRISFAAGDLFAPWVGAAPFDVIVSNPPYIATAPGTPVADNVRDFEPAEALFAGPDGLDVIRRIIAEAPAHLSAGGHLLMEIAFDQAPALRDLLETKHWQDVTTYRDGAGYERVVHARRRAADNAQVA